MIFRRLRASLRHVFILCVLYAPLVAYAQEGWEGDLEAFEIADGTLTLRDGYASESSPTITKDYSNLLPLGSTSLPPLHWRTIAHLGARPSRLNHFEWTIFSIRLESGLWVKYRLAPDDGGRILALKAHVTNSSDDTTSSSASTLADLEIAQPTVSWMDLVIDAYFVPGEGLSFRCSSQSSGFQGESVKILPEGGEIVPKMEFSVVSTPQLGKRNSWVLPTVYSRPSSNLPDLDCLATSFLGIEKLIIRLNKPVHTDGAVASVGDLILPLSHPEPDILFIDLSPLPKVPGEFSLTLKGLVDEAEREESLSIPIEAYDDESDDNDTSSEAVPEGVYFSEIMVNPPLAGRLHGLKYVEILNATSETILPGSLLLVYRSQAFALTGAPIPAGGYAVIVPSGTTIEVPGTVLYTETFPALSGDFMIKLIDRKSNKPLDSYYYSSRSREPGDPPGGYALERVSFVNSSWRTSDNEEGGTPGMPTNMRPHSRVPGNGIVITEVHIPEKEKKQSFLEIYNLSEVPINLSDLYFTYRDVPSKPYIPHKISSKNRIIPPRSYLILSPDTATLRKRYPDIPDATVYECQSLFPLSREYTEMELRSYRPDRLIDRCKYRSAWLEGNVASLERIDLRSDGLERTSWGISPSGASPGSLSDARPITPGMIDNKATSWPEDEQLSLEQLNELLPIHASRATLRINTLQGQTLLEAKGRQVTTLLRELRFGELPLPPQPLLIKVTIDPPKEEKGEGSKGSPISYTSVWIFDHL